MNEHQFGDKVRQILERGAPPDARILERLHAARERALVRQRLGKGSGRGAPWAWARLALPVVILLVGLFGIYGWQQKQKAADLAELDAQLLSGDLPIDAYLDKGFQAWLKQHSGS